MPGKTSALIVPRERIIRQILLLRDEKVMLDAHLAELYGVENRALKQAVRRNIDLFAADFMFVLTPKEMDLMVSQNVIPSKRHLGGANTYAFTESGVAMLSSILKSKRAREMNVAIMRAFVALRKLVLGNTELRLELEHIKKKINDHDKNIKLVFNTWISFSKKRTNRGSCLDTRSQKNKRLCCTMIQ